MPRKAHRKCSNCIGGWLPSKSYSRPDGTTYSELTNAKCTLCDGKGFHGPEQSRQWGNAIEREAKERIEARKRASVEASPRRAGSQPKRMNGVGKPRHTADA